MAARGRPPKPTKVKERAGTLQRCRQKNEPTPDPELPPFPDWASQRAKPYWDEIGKYLYDNGLLTRLDQTALALLCEALCEYCDCRAIFEADAKDGNPAANYVVTTDKGNLIQHPAVGAMNKAWGKAVKMLTQFGMTPSARAGLAIGNAKEKPDLLARLIAQSSQPNAN